mgnify:CR=1 FL=1
MYANIFKPKGKQSSNFPVSVCSPPPNLLSSTLRFAVTSNSTRVASVDADIDRYIFLEGVGSNPSYRVVDPKSRLCKEMHAIYQKVHTFKSIEPKAYFMVKQELGSFDLVLMANLIDRLYKPTDCLALLPGLVNPGMHQPN